MGARDERPRRRELDRAHVLGEIFRIRHDVSRREGAALLAGRGKDRYDSRCRTRKSGAISDAECSRSPPRSWRSSRSLRRIAAAQELAVPADPFHRALPGRRLDRHRRPRHRRSPVARVRPAGRGREQVGRQRQRRLRLRRQERAGRLHGADRAGPGDERAARLQGELRSAEGLRAGDPAFASSRSCSPPIRSSASASSPS